MVGGLVPTRDMSPFSTLKNWGNSSKLLLRIKSPIPVFFCPSGKISLPITRGSKIHLEHHAVLDLILIQKIFLSLLRVQIHAAELVHLKALAVSSNPLLDKENRP